MKTARVCEVCGEEFEPRRKDQRGCEKKYDAIGDAISDSAPTPLSTLLNAKRKPKNTSATRWRMELALRADPIRFALAGVAIF